jgi:hypothetical protein
MTTPMMKGPGFVPTFLYYFVGSSFIALFVLSQAATGTDAGGSALGNPWPVAILFGLLSGGVGGWLNSHTTLELPVNNKGGFVKRLEAALAAKGLAAMPRDAADKAGIPDDVTVYQRTGWTQRLAGRVFVEYDKKTAIVSGRSTLIKAIQKQMASPGA